MSQALYRKYRSKTLDEIVGQDHITSLLKRAIAQGSVSHAYLLTGPRGVGKTSIARIIAHEINKLPYDDESQHLDIIEIDAASNNGVEDVRDLRDKVHIAPSSAEKKIYIIDEVHMLSRQAFNALLKTLEEPPEHVVFILATTDADKLPATIISRVQRFNFRSITPGDVIKHLRSIADKENIDITDDALAIVARHGGGSFRDSIGLLDQLQHANESTIDAEDVRRALGITADESIQTLIDAYRSGDLSTLAGVIRTLEASGVQASIAAEQIIEQLHASIIDHPEDLQLLDDLLSVHGSSHPYIKLLSALARNVAQPTRTTTVAMATASPSVQTPAQPAAVQKPVASAKPATAKKAAPVVPATPAPQPVQVMQSTVDAADFDWNQLIEATSDDIALKSLLAKSSYEIKDDTLIIYCGTKFNAGKLSGARQLPKLSAALQSIGHGGLTVDARPEKAPPKDSQLASVAAIMGGGEEVELAHGN